MDIPIYNIIVNYFLINPQCKKIQYSQLNLLMRGIKQKFSVNIIDCSVDEIKNMIVVFSDFLSIDENLTIYQNNILEYLDQLQPVCQRFGSQHWENEYIYYDYIRNFQI